MSDREVPDNGPGRKAGGHEVVAELLDIGRGDRRDGTVAPAREEVRVQTPAVVLDGRVLPGLDVLDVPEIAVCGLSERRAGRSGLVVAAVMAGALDG